MKRSEELVDILVCPRNVGDFRRKELGRFLGRMVVTLTEELNLPVREGGSTTFRKRKKSRVERWRSGLGRPCGLPTLSLAGAGVSYQALVPPPAHRTGRADFPHPALGQGGRSCVRPRVAAGKFERVQQTQSFLRIADGELPIPQTR